MNTSVVTIATKYFQEMDFSKQIQTMFPLLDTDEHLFILSQFNLGFANMWLSLSFQQQQLYLFHARVWFEEKEQLIERLNHV